MKKQNILKITMEKKETDYRESIASGNALMRNMMKKQSICIDMPLMNDDEDGEDDINIKKASKNKKLNQEAIL